MWVYFQTVNIDFENVFHFCDFKFRTHLNMQQIRIRDSMDQVEPQTNYNIEHVTNKLYLFLLSIKLENRY